MQTAIFWQQKVGNLRDSYISIPWLLIRSIFVNCKVSLGIKVIKKRSSSWNMNQDSVFLCDRHHSCDRDTNITMIFYPTTNNPESRKNGIFIEAKTLKIVYIYAMVAGRWTFVSATAFCAKTECHALRATHCHCPITLEPSFILHKKFRGFLKMHLNRPKTG